MTSSTTTNANHDCNHDEDEPRQPPPHLYGNRHLTDGPPSHGNGRFEVGGGMEDIGGEGNQIGSFFSNTWSFSTFGSALES